MSILNEKDIKSMSLERKKEYCDWCSYHFGGHCNKCSLYDFKKSRITDYEKFKALEDAIEMLESKEHNFDVCGNYKKARHYLAEELRKKLVKSIYYTAAQSAVKVEE